MIRILIFCLAAVVGQLSAVWAQTNSDGAHVLAAGSGMTTDWYGNTVLSLEISDVVPFRVFTLDDPRRLVMDFQGLDWDGVAPADVLDPDMGIDAVRFGAFQPGWSRLVADLAGPMLPDDVSIQHDKSNGNKTLTLRLKSVLQADFAMASGVPADALWPTQRTVTTGATVSDDRFVVVLDPGHGGIDPGAEREGLSEKELMLDVAFEMRDQLLALGSIDVVLTREQDVFVSLTNRVAQAHRARADLFISLHADALSQGGARGATVYTLSEEASDTATAHLAARHNRADIIAGADLTGSDDQVAGILLDLARQETEPRSKALARALVDEMGNVGGPLNNRPLRQAGFSVLKSADIPSVLVEVGFLSSKRDLDNLRDPAWRRTIVAGMVQGVIAWQEKDAAQQLLVRH
ncbi:MAG: N-acetylmuramoyl-L-alanine amidase [Roseobacter sp.]